MKTDRKPVRAVKALQAGKKKSPAWLYTMQLDLRIALTYAIFGGLWILFSDSLLDALVSDHALFARVQTYKGWAFVALSAALVFLLLRRELTVRKTTEEKLEESEERYRQLFENSMDAILLTAPDGSIYAANPSACRMLGRTETEIQRLGRNGVVDTSDPRLKPALEGRARTGNFHGELIFLRADGTRFEGEVSTNIFENAKGEQRTSMIIRDVTGRKQAEESLRESEERYRLLVDKSPYAIGVHQDGKLVFANPAAVRLFGAPTADKMIGRSIMELVSPETRDAASQRIGRMLQGETGLYPTEDRYQRLDGTIFPVEVTAAPFTQDGRPAIQVIALDITERKRAQVDIQRRLNELEALHRASLSFSRLQDMAVVGEQVLEHLRQMMDYQRGALAVRNETSGRLELLAHVRMNLDDATHKREIERVRGFFELPQGITRWVAEHGEPVRTGNVHSDPRYLEADPAIQSEMAVPLKIGERVIGALNVESILPNAFTEHDERLLTTVANVASVSIQNARLLEETRLSRDRLAELSKKLVEVHETEARSIGRELHDQIGQMLTALKLTLEILPQLPAEQSAKKLVGAQELLDELINRVSRLSLELRPPMLDDLGLIPALLWHINRYQEQTGIEVDFQHGSVEGRRFTSEVETTVYRIVQETLTNVARHSHAKRAVLGVHARDGWMEIQIEDNGSGFDLQAAFAKNRGLAGMRERVNLLGGAFQIESQEGKGTRKRIRLPLQEEIK